MTGDFQAQLWRAKCLVYCLGCSSEKAMELILQYTLNILTAKMILASVAMVTKPCLVYFTSCDRNELKLMWVLPMCFNVQ